MKRPYSVNHFSLPPSKEVEMHVIVLFELPCLRFLIRYAVIYVVAFVHNDCTLICFALVLDYPVFLCFGKMAVLHNLFHIYRK